MSSPARARTLIFDCDGEVPVAGALLRPTEGARAWYRLLAVEPVESRKNPNRFRFTVRRCAAGGVDETFDVGDEIVGYRRN